jgi:hypothetical protein
MSDVLISQDIPDAPVPEDLDELVEYLLALASSMDLEPDEGAEATASGLADVYPDLPRDALEALVRDGEIRWAMNRARLK